MGYKEKTDIQIKTLDEENKTFKEKIQEIEKLYEGKKKECDSLMTTLKQYLDKIQKGTKKLSLLE